MINPLLGMLAVLAAMFALSAALQAIQRWAHPPAEFVRKLMHVGMGLVVLTFPWVFHQRWPVVLLSAVAITALIAVRQIPHLRDGIGTVINRVNRPSVGELYFAAAVGILFCVSAGQPLLYCVPMLIMTLADTTAALIGLAYGRVRYVTSEGLKSAEGSIGFFSIAFLSVHIPLLLETDTGRAETLLIALIIGVLSTLLEAISWRGLDNLLIPIGAFAFLKLYLHKSEHELLIRLLATVALLIFALSWRRRSSLDDSALMAGALFGYAAAMLGGPMWLIGPAVLFLAMMLVWPREGVQREHGVLAVMSVVTIALFWLGSQVIHHSPLNADGYAITFGVQLSIIGTSRARSSIANRWQRLAVWITAGWALTLAQALPLLPNPSASTVLLLAITTFAGIFIGTLSFDFQRPRLYAVDSSDLAIHSTGFACALFASLTTVGLLSMIER